MSGEIQIGTVSSGQQMKPESGDHGRIVGAQAKRWKDHFAVCLRPQALAQVSVGSDPPAGDDALQTGVPGGFEGPVHQEVNRRSLEGSGDILLALLEIPIPELIQLIDHGCLQPGVGHVEGVVSLVQRRPGKTKRFGGTAVRKPVDGHPPGETQIVVLGHFVKSLAAGVIYRSAQDPDRVEALDPSDQGVPA